MVSSGTRAIFNVEYSNQVVDLKDGGQADGTPVVGYVFNREGTNLHQRVSVHSLAQIIQAHDQRSGTLKSSRRTRKATSQFI